MEMKGAESILRDRDIEEAHRLSVQAGWNQTKADWKRLLELNPETCFAYRQDSRVVGTATLATYGKELGWIGMVIVDRSFRGQGIGKHLLETVISAGRVRGCRIIGLDATDQGKHLYNQYGFFEVQPIDRWAGVLRPVKSKNTVQKLKSNGLSEALQLDLRWSGCDRSQLFRRLFRDQDVYSWGLIRDNQLQGISFLREGRQYYHLGPVLADTNEDFAELIDAAARILKGQPVLIDAIRRREISVLLKERGLKVQRQLMRMTLDKPQQVLDGPKLRAAVSFEWG